MVTNNESIGVSCSGIFFFENSSPKLNNCIVYSNYLKDTSVIPDTIQFFDTVQMWFWPYDEGYAPEFRNCLVEGGLKKIRGHEYITVFEDVIDTDPLFVDFEGHDFRLRPNSPCVDAGLEDTPSCVLEGVDLEGNARVINGRIDMGPYECLTAALRHQEAVPSFVRLTSNPLRMDSRLGITLERPEEVTVTVHSMRGGTAVSETYSCHAGYSELNVWKLTEQMASGIYLIEVSAQDKVCTLKAVK